MKTIKQRNEELENTKSELLKTNSELAENENKPAGGTITPNSAITDGAKDEKIEKLEKERAELQALLERYKKQFGESIGDEP